MAHLLYNCALKVKSHFEDVDQLIAQVESATVENKVNLLLLVARFSLLLLDGKTD